MMNTVGCLHISSNNRYHQKTCGSLVSDEPRNKLTREGSFSEFLGIKFGKIPDGAINMTQKRLIQKIIEAAGMTDCNPNWTPASITPLGSDPDGERMDVPWNYRSIIVGMLLYLTTNTRPDCALAVSQAARFSHDPMQSHATSVKTIVRYLKITHEKGMIVRPTGVLNLKYYVYASFAGNYGGVAAKSPNPA